MSMRLRSLNPAARRKRREYERWRKATELTQDEYAAGLPYVPSFSEPAAIAPRPRRERGETDPLVVIASFGRATLLRQALGWTFAAIALLTLLPYGLAERDVLLIYGGAIFVLFGLLAAYVAFSTWWYIVRGEMFRSPPWLSRAGRGVLRTLDLKIGR
jgi:hypothetical protein